MPLRLVALLSGSLSLVLSFLLGMTAGRLELRASPTVLREDLRPAIPVVRLEGSPGGGLLARVEGNARVIADGTTVASGSGTFRISPDVVARAAATPGGARFVASKRGKKYYPVGSQGGAKIVPANRIYFSTAAEAEAAGYRE